MSEIIEIIQIVNAGKNEEENEEDEWESAIQNFKIPSAEASPVTVPLETKPAEAVVKPKKSFANPFQKYPYFLAGIEGTILKELFPTSEHPLGSLKQYLSTQEGLVDYALKIRNNYIMPLFYVLKSTTYYNPITKTRVPIKKGERIDPNLSYVNNEDQVKVYKLFGFQGHVGPKKTDEDVKRAELLEKLKNVLYNTHSLVLLVKLMLQRICVEVDDADIQKACDTIRQRSDYEQKSFRLPVKWYHNAQWKKLRYVYGDSAMDKIGGGDGAIPYEVAQCIFNSAAYHV
jgi:hypothetical protein